MAAIGYVPLATAISNKEARQVGRRLGDAGLRWITYQGAKNTTIYVLERDLSTAEELRYPRATFVRKVWAVAMIPILWFRAVFVPTQFPEDEEFPGTHKVSNDGG